MTKMSKKPMFAKYGKAFLRAKKSVRKPRACLTRRSAGPMRIIRTRLKILGEKGIKPGENFSNIRP